MATMQYAHINTLQAVYAIIVHMIIHVCVHTYVRMYIQPDGHTDRQTAYILLGVSRNMQHMLHDMTSVWMALLV